MGSRLGSGRSCRLDELREPPCALVFAQERKRSVYGLLGEVSFIEWMGRGRYVEIDVKSDAKMTFAGKDEKGKEEKRRAKDLMAWRTDPIFEHRVSRGEQLKVGARLIEEIAAHLPGAAGASLCIHVQGAG